MPDIFTKKKRSEIMGRIKAKNTKPELIVRRFLFAHGFRYRIHQRGLPGRPDIVLRKHNTIVIVNGCFWHGHQRCRVFKMPKSRTAFWRSKLSKNRERDQRDRRALRNAGWKVITVWECQLRKSMVEATMRKVVESIRA